ncbi:hypothetical protein [Paracoccus sp. ME4]|uniref:hypothetical protein n=1 Tax=Paracoccus sp. ME4 TaxID=3138066 RepID=UPI00398A904B
MNRFDRAELLAMRDRCRKAFDTINSKTVQLTLIDAADMLHEIAREGAGSGSDAATARRVATAELDDMRTRCRKASSMTNVKTAQDALLDAAKMLRTLAQDVVGEPDREPASEEPSGGPA